MILILVIIQVIIQVIQILIQTPAITHQNFQQMMKNIMIIKDKDYIDHVYILLIIS